MKTRQSYFDDPLCLDFMAEVQEISPIGEGKYSAVLPQTYFYPTSGGQDHDTGKIGDALVLDVYKKEDGRIIHILDRNLTQGFHQAIIDRMRRLQNMQAHTAQHILSRAFEMELNLETLSANINADTPSTIDLEITSSFPGEFSIIEKIANSIVFENRTVKIYSISDDEISRVPFRKTPKVTGVIRVVEVDGFDYSACGGTHCLQTGMIGIIKILKTEIQNKKLRVFFVAGYQALLIFQNTNATISKLAAILETAREDLITTIQKQKENLQLVRTELENVRSQVLATLADQLAASAIDVGNLILVSRILPDRTTEELRKLVIRICSQEYFVSTLGRIDGQKFSLVVGCSNGLQLNAREILLSILKGFNGQGGGDQFLAQGGCIIPAEGVIDLFEISRNYLLSQTDCDE